MWRSASSPCLSRISNENSPAPSLAWYAGDCQRLTPAQEHLLGPFGTLHLGQSSKNTRKPFPWKPSLYAIEETGRSVLPFLGCRHALKPQVSNCCSHFATMSWESGAAVRSHLHVEPEGEANPGRERSQKQHSGLCVAAIGSLTRLPFGHPTHVPVYSLYGWSHCVSSFLAPLLLIWSHSYQRCA